MTSRGAVDPRSGRAPGMSAETPPRPRGRRRAFARAARRADTAALRWLLGPGERCCCSCCSCAPSSSTPFGIPSASMEDTLARRRPDPREPAHRARGPAARRHRRLRRVPGLQPARPRAGHRADPRRGGAEPRRQGAADRLRQAGHRPARRPGQVLCSRRTPRGQRRSRRRALRRAGRRCRAR